jgi:hypothetical protein
MLGSRVTVVSEIPPQTRFDGALIKALLGGGDPMHIRGLFSKGGQVQFTTVLWKSGNEDYGPPPNDDAAYERELTLACTHQVPRGERDDIAQERIVSSPSVRSALLACAVRGFARVYGEQGGRLTPPEEVRKATEVTRNALDRWNSFLEEAVEFTGDKSDAILKSSLWERAKFAKEVELGDRQRWRDLDKVDFEGAVRRRGAEDYQSRARFNNRRCWRGVRWVGGGTPKVSSDVLIDYDFTRQPTEQRDGSESQEDWEEVESDVE